MSETGRRLASATAWRERKEYRPYTAMAQFRREMAKYVDDEEVERLARYVEIR